METDLTIHLIKSALGKTLDFILNFDFNLIFQHLKNIFQKKHFAPHSPMQT